MMGSVQKEVGRADIECPTCHGESFVIVDQKNGLLRCEYCRNQWIDERFVDLSHTEKFLREQAKQPHIVIDNSSDTDQQILGAITGLVNSSGIVSGLLGTAKRVVWTIVGIVLITLAISIAIRVLIQFA